MNNERINKLTGFLWGGVIETIDFNIHKNEIVLHICVHNAERKEDHVLCFLGVSTYYYVNGDNEYRKQLYEIEEDGYLDFTSINYIENMKVLLSDEGRDWLSRYSSETNIYLEMWGKALFIECTGIKIDNQIFMFDQK